MKKSLFVFGIISSFLFLSGCQEEPDSSLDFLGDIQTQETPSDKISMTDSNDLNATALNEFFVQGNTFFAEKKYQEAIEFYDKTLDLLPGEGRLKVLGNKASALYFLEQYPEAITLYDEILAVEPDNVDTLNNKGAALLKTQQFEASIQTYKYTLTLDTNSFGAWYNLGCAYALMGDTEQAIEHLSEAFTLNETLKTYAKTDTDLESLWEDPTFMELVK